LFEGAACLNNCSIGQLYEGVLKVASHSSVFEGARLRNFFRQRREASAPMGG
jgi:hypothetical protein